MKRPPQIPLNQFQLAILLNDDEKQFYNAVLAENVFCRSCAGSVAKGVTVTEIHLTDLNDLLVRGNCKVCKGLVARTFEFGDQKAFYDRAMKFRKDIS